MTFTVKALNEIVDDYIYGDDEIGIDVETPELTAKAQAIDTFLDTLLMTGNQHDALVLLMADYQLLVKKESFLRGFDMGLRLRWKIDPKGTGTYKKLSTSTQGKSF